MAEHGTKFIEGAVPAAVEKLDSGRKKVTWTLKDGTTASDEFDTVRMRTLTLALALALTLTLTLPLPLTLTLTLTWLAPSAGGWRSSGGRRLLRCSC